MYAKPSQIPTYCSYHIVMALDIDLSCPLTNQMSLFKHFSGNFLGRSIFNDTLQCRKYFLLRHLLISLLFLTWSVDIGLTAPAMDLFHTKLRTLSGQWFCCRALEAKLEEALVLTTPDGICSLTLTSFMLTLRHCLQAVLLS